MNAEEVLQEIKEWANSSHSYLSENCQYARGYKAGIAQAKRIVLDMLGNTSV